MRTVLYKAKEINKKDWKFGSYFKHQNRTLCPMGDCLTEADFSYYIISTGFSDFNMPTPIEAFDVMEETVCEYTGKDIGTEKIFENDIISFMHHDRLTDEYYSVEGLVIHTEKGWKVSVFGEDSHYAGVIPLMDIFFYGEPKIVGNSIDNPEMVWGLEKHV